MQVANRTVGCFMLLTFCLSTVIHSECINALHFSICKAVDKESAAAAGAAAFTTRTVTTRIIVVKAVPTKVLECDIKSSAKWSDDNLQELDGRPRVDVLCNMSGIFRDSFQNVVELLDDLFKRAAQAPESPDMNFIRCACCS